MNVPEWKIKKSIKVAQRRRDDHYFNGKRGWSVGKNQEARRSELAIPMWIYLHPEIRYRYFPENADDHERVKLMEEFKRDYPMYRSHG